MLSNESTDAPDWTFKAPQAVRASVIVGFFKTPNAGVTKIEELATPQKKPSVSSSYKFRKTVIKPRFPRSGHAAGADRRKGQVILPFLKIFLTYTREFSDQVTMPYAN